MNGSKKAELARKLLTYSVAAKKGDRVLIEATDVPYEFVTELIKATYEVGAEPFVVNIDSRVRAEVIKGSSDEQLEFWAQHDADIMRNVNCYIGVRGTANIYENTEVDDERITKFLALYNDPVHGEIRVKKTRWVVLRYPTAAMAKLAGMPADEFEEFFFNVCTLDYARMGSAMDALKAYMDRTERVRIVAKDTDISFSVKGINAVKCCGKRNIPDGEVYTAPVKDSVNGVITYNTPSVYNGTRFEWVRLEFKDGKIVNSDSSDKQKSDAIFNTDEGARYVGEFSIGLNPYIKRAMGDILFDEKISGSIHFTPGCCYDAAYNGNISAVHWDLVLLQTPDAGGGQIYFDGVLIRDNGRFVVPELLGLNPENLM